VRSGGQLLADQLALHGVELAFCVPGESYLALLDGLYSHRSTLRVITCRHEAAAANAADAYGKLTGRPGVCMVTRGPGATHASTGVHTAMQDSTPLVLLVGQVPRTHRGREAFQEIDYEQMFGGIAKWVYEIDRPERIPEIVARAFATAVAGRPGPVVLALPEDVLSALTDAGDALPVPRVAASPGAAELAAMRELLASAERPLAIVGGSGWSPWSAADLSAFLTANGIPAAASFRCQDVIDNRLPIYAGDLGLGVNPALAKRVREADVVLAVGTRLSETETGSYTYLTPPDPAQTLIHVHQDPAELGRVYRPQLGIVSSLPEFAAAARALEPVDGSRFAGWAEAARADYEGSLSYDPAPGDGVDLAAVLEHLRGRLPDAIVANGAGNYTVWVHRFWQFSSYRSQLAPLSGAMGYGVPASLAGKLVHPDRPVIAFAGDGCFLMCAQELATMVAHNLQILVIVVNNGMLGTIRMHQERHYPGRVIGTDLVNPDFSAFARSFGVYGERVETTGAFEAALERALEAGGPALLELVCDPEALTPRQSLSQARAQGEANRSSVSSAS
jgi:acetolactate synthase I/II/III large subunit